MNSFFQQLITNRRAFFAFAVIIAAFILIVVLGNGLESCRQRRVDKQINGQLENANVAINAADNARDNRLIETGKEIEIEKQISNQNGDLKRAEENTNHSLDNVNAIERGDYSSVSDEQLNRKRCAAFPKSANCRRR